jgi:hypothetical protein
MHLFFFLYHRIFQVGTRVFADGQVGNFEETGMTYPDFIFFMLSEEDKSSVCALRYWYVFPAVQGFIWYLCSLWGGVFDCSDQIFGSCL